MIIFYCRGFETPPTWRARSSYLYPTGTWWPSYTLRHWAPFPSLPTTRRATVEVFEPTSTRVISSNQVKVTLQLTVSRIVTVLFLCGALSDERTGLSFVYAAGHHQRSLSRARVPWVSWPYITVSHLRPPFSSPSMTCRVTVEVFDPAFTRNRSTEYFYHYVFLHNLESDLIENTSLSVLL
jgi:hypothetical protein